MDIKALWANVKTGCAFLAAHITLVLFVLVGILSLIIRSLRSTVAVQKAAKEEQQQKDTLQQEKKEEQDAQKQASDSRADWDSFAKPYRGSSGPDGTP